MIRLLQWLFHGCLHEWDIIRRGTIRSEYGDRIGLFYDCRCKKCGRIKEFRT